MAFDLDLTLAFTLKDGTSTVGYLAKTLSGEDHDEIFSGADEIATGVSNQAVALGGITTVEALALKSDFEVTVKFNGEATGHLCTNLLLTGAAITAITLSNASGSLATVRYAMCGT